MNYDNGDNFLYGHAETEEDQPRDIPEEKAGDNPDRLDEIRLAVREKDKERKERRYFTAFNLIIACLAILVGIYLIETFIKYKTGQGIDGLAENIIEIIKTLLFTLSGYLFARKENGD